MGKQEETAEEVFFTEDAAHDKHPKSCLPQLGSRQTVWAKTGITHSLTPALLGGIPTASQCQLFLLIIHIDLGWVCLCMFLDTCMPRGMCGGQRTAWGDRSLLPPYGSWWSVSDYQVWWHVPWSHSWRGKKPNIVFVCLFMCVYGFMCAHSQSEGHIKANVKFFVFLFPSLCVWQGPLPNLLVSHWDIRKLSFSIKFEHLHTTYDLGLVASK